MLPPVLALSTVAAFGLCIGSFLNVVIARLPEGKSLVFPPSTCPRCGHLIAWFDNIPVAVLAPAARPLPELPGAHLMALSGRRGADRRAVRRGLFRFGVSADLVVGLIFLAGSSRSRASTSTGRSSLM